jgi:hypothetical protein
LSGLTGHCNQNCNHRSRATAGLLMVPACVAHSAATAACPPGRPGAVRRFRPRLDPCSRVVRVYRARGVPLVGLSDPGCVRAGTSRMHPGAGVYRLADGRRRVRCGDRRAGRVECSSGRFPGPACRRRRRRRGRSERPDWSVNALGRAARKTSVSTSIASPLRRESEEHVATTTTNPMSMSTPTAAAIQTGIGICARIAGIRPPTCGVAA